MRSFYIIVYNYLPTFSNAFDMVRHTALLGKLDQLDIPDTMYTTVPKVPKCF